MSSPVVPSDPTPIPAPSSTPPTSPAGEPVAAASPPSPAPWRAPETADPAFRGKTADEILGLATTLYGVAQRFNQQGVVPSAPAPAAPAYAPPPAPEPLVDNDFVTGGAVRSYVDQQAAYVQQSLAQTMQANAALALTMARQQHADTFRRYGPEIESELARVPVHLRTLDNLTTIVDVVRGRHVNELAEEKARELAATLAPTLRSNGAGGPAAPSSAPSLSHANVPDAWRQKALAVGLDDAQIADFAKANGMTVETFYKQFSGGLIQAAAADPTLDRRLAQGGR